MKHEASGQPAVSILVNNHNYGCFLREAIDSALRQTYPNTEVIVVDDGSTDSSREIIASYSNSIIPVLKENGGQASAFNAGFAASRGDWILLLDSDDLFLPTKAEEVLRLAEQNPQAGVIAHNLDYCGVSGEPTEFLPLRIRQHELIDDQRRVRRGTSTAYLPATSGLCFRRDILGQILPMPEEIRGQPDNYIKFVALSLTPVLQVPRVLARQRIHERSCYTSSLTDMSDAVRFPRARFRAEFYFHLWKRYPYFSRLVWKQYSVILCQLTVPRSREARALRAEIRQRYSVVEWSPLCLYYVAKAFTRTLVGYHARTRLYPLRARLRRFAMNSRIPLLRTCDKAVTATLQVLRRATG